MGRRWGKTFMCGDYGLTVADFGGTVAWVAPTYKNSRPLWRFVEQQLSGTRGVAILRGQRVAEFPSGGRISVFSADREGDSLRSDSFDLVIVDEAARVAENAIYDAIMPTLADRDGILMAISTPKGRNWFWREAMRAESGDKSVAFFRAPSNANPIASIQRAYDQARSFVSDRTFRQEWNAEFVDDTGGVFRNYRNCTDSLLQPEGIGGHAYSFGVDWGRTTDFTVITVLDTTLRSVVAIDRFTDIDWHTQLMRVKALYDKFKPYVVWAESNSMGGPLAESLIRMNIPVRPFNTTNESKRSIIDSLSLAFESGNIHIPNMPSLLVELDAYEVKTTSTGIVKTGAPPGLHDDHIISLALAWQAVAGGSIFV